MGLDLLGTLGRFDQERFNGPGSVNLWAAHSSPFVKFSCCLKGGGSLNVKSLQIYMLFEQNKA